MEKIIFHRILRDMHIERHPYDTISCLGSFFDMIYARSTYWVQWCVVYIVFLQVFSLMTDRRTDYVYSSVVVESTYLLYARMNTQKHVFFFFLFDKIVVDAIHNNDNSTVLIFFSYAKKANRTTTGNPAILTAVIKWNIFILQIEIFARTFWNEKRINTTEWARIFYE